MSRSARFRSPFGDGVYDFALGIGQLEELQELTDAGPEEVFDRISERRWKLADLRHTIRLGLIGAGVDQFKALALVERYAGPGDLLALKPICTSIIAAALVGAPDEDKKSGEMKGERSRSPGKNSGSETSTPSEERSASPRKRSRKPQSGG
jgi:hypothetical protein